MKNDFITLFNRLTSSKLADYSLFSDMIENHYEKFKFLYYMINNIDLNNIDSIYSKTSKKELKTTIVPKNVKYANNVIFEINKRKQDYQYAEYFEIDLSEKNNNIQITISIVDNKKEGEIYENRFI